MYFVYGFQVTYEGGERKIERFDKAIDDLEWPDTENCAAIARCAWLDRGEIEHKIQTRKPWGERRDFDLLNKMYEHAKAWKKWGKTHG